MKTGRGLGLPKRGWDVWVCGRTFGPKPWVIDAMKAPRDLISFGDRPKNQCLEIYKHGDA